MGSLPPSRPDAPVVTPPFDRPPADEPRPTRSSAHNQQRLWTQRKWFLPVVIIVTLLVGIGIGAASDSATQELVKAQDENDELSSQNETLTSEVEAKDTQIETLVGTSDRLADQVTSLEEKVAGLEAQLEKQANKPQQPANGGGDGNGGGGNGGGGGSGGVRNFGDGTYRVGSDIDPGTYRAPGGNSCYWERLSGFGGDLNDIITNEVAVKNPVVTIEASDAGFSTDGCGTWERL